MALVFLVAASMTMAQARYVADHPSQYSIWKVHTAVEMLRVPPSPLPDHPDARYIADHPSRFSVIEVHRAVETLKAQREAAAPSGG